MMTHSLLQCCQKSGALLFAQGLFFKPYFRFFVPIEQRDNILDLKFYNQCRNSFIWSWTLVEQNKTKKTRCWHKRNYFYWFLLIFKTATTTITKTKLISQIKLKIRKKKREKKNLKRTHKSNEVVFCQLLQLWLFLLLLCYKIRGFFMFYCNNT